MIARSVGPQQALQLFQERLGMETPKLQGRWNRTLANMYGNHFSAAEFRPPGKERERSPYYAKLQSESPAIAAEMKSAGSLVLARLLKPILVLVAKDAAPSGRQDSSRSIWIGSCSVSPCFERILIDQPFPADPKARPLVSYFARPECA